MPRPAPSLLPWAVAASAGVLAVVLSPPWLPEPAARAVWASASWLCHQLPERTMHVGGLPVALCHRCLGMLVGLVAGLVAAPAAPHGVRGWTSARAQARVLIAAALPMGADWLLGALGVWANTPASRSATGAAFGVVAGLLVGANLVRAAGARPAGGPGAGNDTGASASLRPPQLP